MNNNKKKNNDFDDEERQLVLDFENTVLRGGTQFFDVDELEVIIDYYFEVNDQESLQRAVEYAEQLYPDSTTIRLRRAHLLIAQQQYEPALEMIQKLRRQEPHNTDVAYSLGVAYGAVGEREKAIELYHEAAEDGWLLGRVYANIAEEYYHLHNFDEAIRYYLLSLDTDTYDDSTLYNYLDTCIQAGRTDDAVTYLKSFVGEHPYSSEAWHCLGTAYRELGLFEQSVDAYEYAIAIDKTNVAFYADLATTQEYMSRPGDAVTTLLRGRDFVNDRAALYRTVAYVYARADNNEMAILYFRKAIEENPEDAEAYAALALGYAVSGDQGSAIPLIKKALHLAPESPEVLCSAGIVYDIRGNFDAASDYFERMLATDNCTEIQCQHYTQFLFNHQLYDMVVDFALESLDLYPGHPFYSTYLAAAAFYSNRYNRASHALPDADPALLHELCPEIFGHPRLSPLIPDNHPTT